MPIRKERRHLYPGGGIHSAEWKAMRAAILLRAGNRCEAVDAAGNRCAAIGGAPNIHNPHARVPHRLTCAHLYPDDEATRDLARLLLACERCHNRLDVPHRLAGLGLPRFGGHR